MEAVAAEVEAGAAEVGAGPGAAEVEMEVTNGGCALLAACQVRVRSTFSHALMKYS